MTVIVANNVKGTLLGGSAPGSTSIVLNAGHNFPAITAGDYLFATWISPANTLEVVKVTARATNTLTVSATANAWGANDRLEMRACKELLDALQQEALTKGAVVLTGTDTYTGNATPAPLAYTVGAVWALTFPNANTITTPTAALNGLAAKTLVDQSGGAPAAGAIKVGSQHLARYDGTHLVLLTLSPAQVVVNPPAIQVRQAPQSGAVDSNGYANWLSAGTGLAVNLAATAAAVVLAFAAGFTSFGASDLVTQLTADATNQFGTLAANNTSFLASDYSSPTAMTGSNTLCPPQDGYTFDRTKQALLNFEGTNGQATTTDDFGNTWTITGGSLSTAQSKFGLSSLAINGTAQYIGTADITSLGGGSFEVIQWFRATASSAFHSLFSAQNAGTFGGLIFLDHNAGARRLATRMSSDGSTFNISSANGTTTTIALNTWYRFRYQYDALSGNYRLFLSNNGAAESLELTVSSALRLCSVQNVFLGHSTVSGLVDFAGNIDAFSITPYITSSSAVTPGGTAPAVTDQKTCWFDKSTKVMREVTTASVTGGVNPGFTARNRLFVGEADTGPTTVTAVRNYAYLAEYTVAGVAMAAGVTQSFNHNIGAPPLVEFVDFECLTADGLYSPGDRLGHRLENYSIDMGYSSVKRRNTYQFQVAASAIGGARSAGGDAALTPGSWRPIITLKRGW